MFQMLIILLAFTVNNLIAGETVSKESPDFIFNDAHVRHSRLRCMQRYPLADADNYSDNAETHCFLQCFLYRMGLMDLATRGLDSRKFIDIWERIDEAFEEDACMERFYFNEPLAGNCSDTYRKLMEFRNNCLELFDYTFSSNSTWKSEDSKSTKKVGQSATEFCDTLEVNDNVEAKESSEEDDVTLLSQYMKKLICIFENIHYLDAYGRVDQSEIIMSYKEAQEDSVETRSIITICSHRANTKFQQHHYGHMVLELQKCLKSKSPIYGKVYQLRDELSRQY
ncbi:hypothetical protein DOY81_001592 [Sarcophaga bullata]|nr:hypothetical protein DOY81_001592 [Sarcophaga bullata]